MKPFYILYIILFFSAIAFSQDNDLKYQALNQELKNARELKENGRLADAYFNLAKYEEEIHLDDQEAFEYYTRSKQYYDRSNNVEQSMLINHKIARQYAKTGFRSEALRLYNTLVDFYQKNGQDSILARTYFEIGKIYKDKGETDKAIVYYNKSIDANKVENDSLLMFDYNLEKIESLILLRDYNKAIGLAKEINALAANINDNARLAKSNLSLGKIYLLNRDLDESQWHLTKAISQSSSNILAKERAEAYSLLSNVYYKKNDFKLSLEYKTAYASLKDSLNNFEQQKALSDLTIKHQLDQKLKDLKLLELENKSVLSKFSITRNSLYALTLGCVGLLVLLYFVVNFYNQKMKVEKIINDQQHEIDSQKIRELEDNIKISSMQSMIVGQEKERERIATDLHDSLGGLLSAVKLQFDQVKTVSSNGKYEESYNKATDLLDTAVSEVRNISRNLQPSALKKLGLVSAIKDLINRFDAKDNPEIFFQYYNMEEKINDITALSIYRIIQELLNNTIKHANAKEVLIQITREGNEIIIEYEDDGVGIDQNKKKGMGLDNINYRVNFLKGTMSIDSDTNKGVSFLIRIPYVFAK